MQSETPRLRKRFLFLFLLPVAAVIVMLWPAIARWYSGVGPETVANYHQAVSEGDVEKALHLAELLTAATEGEPSHKVWRTFWAQHLFAVGRHREAEAQYELVFKTSYADEARRSRAAAYAKAGEEVKALGDLLAIADPDGYDYAR